MLICRTKTFSCLLKCLSREANSKLHLSRSMSQSSAKIAVCQLTSTSDKQHNIDQSWRLLEKCKEQGVQWYPYGPIRRIGKKKFAYTDVRVWMAFLPEGFDSICENKQISKQSAEEINGPTISAYQSMARSLGMWLSLGGFKLKKSDGDKLLNTHLIMSSEGDIVAQYNKMHLFDVDIPGRVRLCESDYTEHGGSMVTPVKTPIGMIGLGTCYDLRFPEFSSLLKLNGAEILTYPSAFTIPTGEAHWEVLLRTRAIENQCYVIAAAQVGQHNHKRSSYGHSMIVDPWGKVLCKVTDGIGIGVAEVDFQRLLQVRTNMPCTSHRREDIYGLIGKFSANFIIDQQVSYTFGQVNVSSEQVFLRSTHSYAFVNRKPVLPGHMLVSPLEKIKRYRDLSPQQVADLFETVRKVGDAIEKEFESSSLTIAVQDGADAGQTIEHVHVHVIPRKKDDLKDNDDIYDKLYTHDKQVEGDYSNEKSAWRGDDEMKREAFNMRKYFY